MHILMYFFNRQTLDMLFADRLKKRAYLCTTCVFNVDQLVPVFEKVWRFIYPASLFGAYLLQELQINYSTVSLTHFKLVTKHHQDAHVFPN